MKILKLTLIVMIISGISGCVGLEKRVVPDELSLSADYNPLRNQVDEITGGAKWKLK